MWWVKFSSEISETQGSRLSLTYYKAPELMK